MHNIYLIPLSLLLGLLVVAGCATTPKSDGEPDSGNAAPVRPNSQSTKAAFPAVDLEVPSAQLSEVVRTLGERVGGGIVVMCGIGENPTPDLVFKNKKYADVVGILAEETGNSYEYSDGYYFLYPKGYESLLDVSLSGKIHERFADEVISFSIGANTAVYNVFSLLGQSLGVTIIADNFIADARCGEITLENVSLQVALEAVLRSARVPQDGFRVASTEDYIFFSAAKLQEKVNRVTNNGADYLDKRLDCYLPKVLLADDKAQFYDEIYNLSQVRGSLAQQLGVCVELADGLEKLPINPSVMKGATIADILNLIIWQWPVDDISVEATAECVRFSSLTSE